MPQTGRRSRDNAAGVEVYGPADAPLGLVRGRRRKRFLVRANREVDLSAYLAAWKARVKVPGAIRLMVDVDPMVFCGFCAEIVGTAAFGCPAREGQNPLQARDLRSSVGSGRAEMSRIPDLTVVVGAAVFTAFLAAT